MRSIFIFSILVFIAAAYGWISNVVTLVYLAAENAPIGAMFIGRVAGVFIPFLGVVLGFVS